MVLNIFKEFINFFYPKTCFACNLVLTPNENGICIDCRHELPECNYYLERENPVTRVFYGRAEVEYGSSLFRFHKRGLVQQLIHNLKYRGHEEIGEILGKWMGHKLAQTVYYKGIDHVIPVPLHKKKFKKRGYNQVEKFGREIAFAIKAEFRPDFLVKTSSTNTQVFKSRMARWDASKEIFKGRQLQKLNNKHILLVDDLITTGSTMENCINALRDIKPSINLKISIATMAIA